MNKGGVLYYFGDPEPGRAFKQQGNGINQAVTRKAGFPGDTQRNEATELATLQAFSNNMSGDTWLEAAASVSSRLGLAGSGWGRLSREGCHPRAAGLFHIFSLLCPLTFPCQTQFPEEGCSKPSTVGRK